MPVNQFDDNEFGWAADFNADSSALGGDAIISGCSISKGTGDWDIDVTSGQIIQGNTEAAISSGTVTITDSSGLTSGQSRVTLIHADTGDALASTDGTAATDPASPDIPAGEVLLGFVVVADTDSTAADSDIFDVPALLGDDSTRYELQGSHELNFPGNIYGDETDGSVTRSSNVNENGIIQATDYTLEAGNTATVTNGILVIHATGSITINGTIDASGQGAGADSTGFFNWETGSGGSGTSPGSNGGAGAGGGGGSGSSGNDAPRQTTRPLIPSAGASETGVPALGVLLLPHLGVNAASGGGSGGDGGGASSGSGGAGGAGGGYVALIAPSITIGGTIDVSGADGANGGSDASSGGGGGGGGAGGVMELVYESITENTPTYTLAGGAGGTGGNDTTDGDDDGGNGGGNRAGLKRVVDLP